MKYTTIEKERLPVVLILDKFHSYFGITCCYFYILFIAQISIGEKECQTMTYQMDPIVSRI